MRQFHNRHGMSKDHRTDLIYTNIVKRLVDPKAGVIHQHINSTFIFYHLTKLLPEFLGGKITYLTGNVDTEI